MRDGVVKDNVADDRGALRRARCVVTSFLADACDDGDTSLLHVGVPDPEVLEAFARLGLDVRSASDVDAVCRFPFSSTTFDFTYAESVLERASSLSLILSESLRVLRPGGRAVFVSPLPGEQAHADDRVVRTFTRRTLREALIVYGFEAVTCYRFSTGWPARAPLSASISRWVASLFDATKLAPLGHSCLTAEASR
jgi:SAM-dependent methyltransferase